MSATAKGRAAKPAPKRSRSGPTLAQAERRARGIKQIVSVSLTPTTLAELDRLRGDVPRSSYVERLIMQASGDPIRCSRCGDYDGPLGLVDGALVCERCESGKRSK